MSSIQDWIARSDLNAPLHVDGQTFQGLPAIIACLSKMTLSKETKVSCFLLLNKAVSVNPDLPSMDTIVDSFFKDQASLMNAFNESVSQNDVEGARRLFLHFNQKSRSQISSHSQDLPIQFEDTEIITFIANQLLSPADKKRFYQNLEDRWAQDSATTKALMKILVCRSQNFTELNLSGLDLTSLPPFLLRELPALENLYIGSNRLTSFTIPAGSLTALRNLYLDGNQLTSFTIPADALPALRNLYLDRNQLTSFTIIGGELPALQELRLSKNLLTSVTIPTGALPTLLRLELSENQLTSFEIPEGALPALQTLNLNENQLTSFTIPEGVLPALQTLHLNQNRLTSFTIPAGTLLALRSLILYDNRLTSFTISEGGLPALKELWLYNNRMTSFTIPADALLTLRSLYLYDNQLTSFEIPEGALPALQTLNLNKNQLTSFTIPEGGLPALQTLHLNQNRLTSFTIPAGTLLALRSLILYDNQLTSFIIPAGPFPGLLELFVSDNQLTSFTIPEGGLPALQMLFLTDNQLMELPLTLQDCHNITSIEVDAPLRNQADLFLSIAERARSGQALEKLPEKVQVWKAYSGKDYDFSFVAQLDDSKQRILYEWLHRLENTSEFRNNQKGLTAIVCDILASLNPDASNYSESFAESFYEMVPANLERCGDRAGETLNIIYAAWSIHHLPQDATDQQKLEILVKAAKAFSLSKAIAIKLAGEANQEENVEVHLFYKTLFQDEILTAVKTYTYAGMGDRRNNPPPTRITEEELKAFMEENYWSELTDLDPFKNIILKNPDFQKEYNDYLVALGIIPDDGVAQGSLPFIEKFAGFPLDDKTLAIQKALMIEHAKRILLHG